MNVFRVMATLGLDSSAYDKGLANAEGKAQSFGSKLASGMGTAIKAVGTAITAASAAVGALVTSAVKSYAEYEQLVGGVETLFGAGGKSLEEYAKSVGKSVDEAQAEFDRLMQSQETVLANAAEAYKTAGLSANEYMETVTGFSASLLQSVGGDTAKAAKIADRAIRDMSDNANKMGTSMKSIQTAYQGFAKQNYTMLDNLKLGYGGTKTEMERLIKDAEELDETFKATRDTNGELTLSYADVVEAIGIVQTQMGITGTTALEASETISGSVASMKSAWANLVTGIADENADFEGLINNLVETVGTAAGNILPRIEIALGGVGKLVEGLAPVIGEALPKLVAEVLPGLVNAATGLLDSMVEQLPSLAGAGVDLFGTLLDNVSGILIKISDQAPDLIRGIADKLLEGDNIERMVDTGVDLFVALVSNIPDIVLAVAEKLPEIVERIAGRLLDAENLDKMADAMVKLFTELPSIFDAVYRGAVNLIAEVVSAFATLLTGGVAKDQMKNAIIDLFTLSADEVAVWFAGTLFGDTAGKLVDSMLTTLGGTMDDRQRSGDIDDKLMRPIREVAGEAAQESMRGHGSAIGEAFADGVNSGFDKEVDKTRNGIIAEFNLIVDAVEGEMEINSPSKVFGRIGRFMAEGVGVGFDNKIPDIKRTLKQRMRDLVSTVQNEMQIASPSKVFAAIGKFMAMGIEQGWESEISSVNAAISSSIDTEYSGSAPRGGWTLNVYAPKMTPAEAFEEAQRVADDAQFLGFAPVTA